MVERFRLTQQVASALVLGLLMTGHGLASELPDSGSTRTDRFHQAVTESVTSAANWLDSFFDDEHYLVEENKSRLKLTFSSFSEQDEGTDFNGKVSLRVRLPHLENRAQLIISGSSEDLLTTGSDWEEIDDDFGGDDEEHMSIGVRYSLKQSARENSSITGGVRFRSGSPVFFIQPRYRVLKRLDNWDFRFIQRFSWYDDTGFESRTEFKFDRLLSETLFFRTIARVDWYEDEPGVYPQLRFSLRRPLSQNRVLALQWTSFFETKPESVLDSSVLKLRYRQRLWRKWLWFEASPQIKFPEDRDYDAVPGILFKLEVNFEPNR